MTEPVHPLKDHVVAGVRLDKYASVHAAVGDGFPLPAVLQHEGIAVEAWDAIETAWAKALLHSFKGEGHLVVAYDEQLLAAKDRMWRPTPPIDGDVRLWLDFFRHWAAAEDPMGFLARHRIGIGDFTRLHRYWSAKLEKDEALRREAFEALCIEPGPVPAVEPGPAVLPPPRDPLGAVPSPPAALPSPAAAPSTDATAPSTEDKATLPSLAVPLPPSPDGAQAPKEGVPRKSVAPAPGRAATPMPRSYQLEVDKPAASAAAAKLTLATYASLCAELEVFPADADIAYGKYGLHDPAARNVERATWESHLASDTSAMAEWKVQYENFLNHWRAMRAAMRKR